MKYAVNDEGISALTTTASQLAESLPELLNKTSTLHTLADAGANTLGPHKASLNGAIKIIYESIKTAAIPVDQISASLKDLAEAYQEIIDNDHLHSNGSTTGENDGFISARGTSVGRCEPSVELSGKQWAESLTDSGKEAVVAYTGTAYVNINATLRGLEKQFEPGNYERALSLHQSLQSASLPSDCTVYRGVSSKALGALRMLPDNMLVGKVFSDKGFMSTSIDRNSAFSGDILLVIDAPKGSHGAYVGDISSAGHHEREVLFDAGSKMRIKGVTRDEYGRRVISVTLLN